MEVRKPEEWDREEGFAAICCKKPSNRTSLCIYYNNQINGTIGSTSVQSLVCSEQLFRLFHPISPLNSFYGNTRLHGMIFFDFHKKYSRSF